MTILKDISVLWSLPQTLVMFALLFESRYPRKKTVILSLSTMLPLLAVNYFIYTLIDGAAFVAMLGTCVLPSLIFFWFLAKHRDGRFLFTFCLSDTLWLEIIYVTNILDHFIGSSHVFMLVSRLILYPAIELFLWKLVRPIYLSMQNSVKKGWYMFSAIGAIFYVMMLLSMSVPTMIMERPVYLPAFVLQLVLMPVVYAHIIVTLRRQQQLHETEANENILQLQVTSLRSRIDEFSAANELLKEERHDFRHKLRTLAALAESGQNDELKRLAGEYAEAMPERNVETYCNLPVLDAVLSSYLGWAQRRGIETGARLSLPKELPVNEAELATVFANAIENAIHACEKLPEGQRSIDIQVLTEPCFMMQVKNSFDGVIAFDDEGVPISRSREHGFGTRSIVTFCEKYGAFYEFKAVEKFFYLRIVFSDSKA